MIRPPVRASQRAVTRLVPPSGAGGNRARGVLVPDFTTSDTTPRKSTASAGSRRPTSGGRESAQHLGPAELDAPSAHPVHGGQALDVRRNLRGEPIDQALGK